MEEKKETCKWVAEGYVAGQTKYRTTCGAVTTAIVGTVIKYNTCPFCKNPVTIQ